MSIINSIFGEKVQRRKPDAEIMAPAIVTVLHPNLLARKLARGPEIVVNVLEIISQTLFLNTVEENLQGGLK